MTESKRDELAEAIREGVPASASGGEHRISAAIDAAIRQMKRDGVIVYSRKKGCWVRA
jgi:hypothetical protein